jgi:acetyltransferase (GNAT) family protein
MYALERLSPRNATSFTGVALAGLRPILERVAGLPNVVGVGATMLGTPIGLAVAVILPGRTTARLLTLFVAPAYRRAKIGVALMQHVESDLRARGSNTIEALVPGDAAGACALDRFFSSLGWAAPTLDSVRCVAEHRRMLSAPWLQATADQPNGYDVLPWVDLSGEERESIRSRQAEHQWFPPDLDPFHHERMLDAATSLALRHRGEVVGWMITHRVSPAELSYTCGFVRADLARRGRFIPLLRAALRREVGVAPDVEHIGIWSTPAHHASMVRFERTHMAPFCRAIVETRRYLGEIGGAGSRSRDRPNETSSSVALARPRCVRVPDVEARREAEALVRRAFSEWPSIHSALDVHGADDAAARTVVAPLLPSIASAVSRLVGATVDVRADWPSPTVVVVTADRLARLPLASVDAPAAVLSGPSSPQAPLAVTLPLALPTGGAAWTCWDLADEETVGLADFELHALLDARAHARCPMADGMLAVHDARAYRQLAPLCSARAGDPLILVQAIARRVDGDAWVLHG